MFFNPEILLLGFNTKEMTHKHKSIAPHWSLGKLKLRRWDTHSLDFFQNGKDSKVLMRRWWSSKNSHVHFEECKLTWPLWRTCSEAEDVHTLQLPMVLLVVRPMEL